MKRIIREVITLVRIERWLVQDDMQLISTSNLEPSIEHQTEESLIDAQGLPTDDLRVIAQKVLESQQWELSTDGAFSSKCFHNTLQTPKEGE